MKFMKRVRRVFGRKESPPREKSSEEYISVVEDNVTYKEDTEELNENRQLRSHIPKRNDTSEFETKMLRERRSNQNIVKDVNFQMKNPRFFGEKQEDAYPAELNPFEEKEDFMNKNLSKNDEYPVEKNPFGEEESGDSVNIDDLHKDVSQDIEQIDKNVQNSSGECYEWGLSLKSEIENKYENISPICTLKPVRVAPPPPISNNDKKIQIMEILNKDNYPPELNPFTEMDEYPEELNPFWSKEEKYNSPRTTCQTKESELKSMRSAPLQPFTLEEKMKRYFDSLNCPAEFNVFSELEEFSKIKNCSHDDIDNSTCVTSQKIESVIKYVRTAPPPPQPIKKPCVITKEYSGDFYELPEEEYSKHKTLARRKYIIEASAAVINENTGKSNFEKLKKENFQSIAGTTALKPVRKAPKIPPISMYGEEASNLMRNSNNSEELRKENSGIPWNARASAREYKVITKKNKRFTNNQSYITKMKESNTNICKKQEYGDVTHQFIKNENSRTQKRKSVRDFIVRLFHLKK